MICAKTSHRAIPSVFLIFRQPSVWEADLRMPWRAWCSAWVIYCSVFVSYWYLLNSTFTYTFSDFLKKCWMLSLCYGLHRQLWRNVWGTLPSPPVTPGRTGACTETSWCMDPLELEKHSSPRYDWVKHLLIFFLSVFSCYLTFLDLVDSRRQAQWFFFF